jgi:RNA polymerase sigma-70 factor (ECF subfamily)
MSAEQSLRSLEFNDKPVDGLAEIHRDHGNWLMAFLRRRFGREEAEELVQETYVRIVGRQVEIRNPRAFLARVAINAAQNRAEARAVRPQLVSDDQFTLGVAEASHQDEALALKQAILALPPKLQEVFLLSRFAGLTSAETPGSAAGEGVPQPPLQTKPRRAGGPPARA